MYLFFNRESPRGPKYCIHSSGGLHIIARSKRETKLEPEPTFLQKRPRNIKKEKQSGPPPQTSAPLELVANISAVGDIPLGTRTPLSTRREQKKGLRIGIMPGG
jgi:hypothetical protein